MKKDVVTLEDLQRLMVEKGCSIRAIPLMSRVVVELRHKDKFPNGHAQYLEGFNREMWVEERKNAHGGQFVVESNCGTGATIRFSGKKFYTSLEELFDDMKD